MKIKRECGLAKLISATGGAAAVEFAIVANVFIGCVFGIAYVAVMLFNNSSLNVAVARAARMAAINKSITQADIATSINSYLHSVGIGNATVAYSVSTVNGVQTASISANLNQTIILPLISSYTLNFSSSTSVPQGS